MSLNLREQLHTEMKLFHTYKAVHPHKVVIAAGCGGTVIYSSRTDIYCGGTDIYCGRTDIYCGGMIKI